MKAKGRNATRCHVCGGTFDAGGSCQRCSGDGAQPEPKSKPPPEPVCTHEENMVGLAALRAAVFGKEGPMAKEITKVVARLKVTTEKPGEEEVAF